MEKTLEERIQNTLLTAKVKMFTKLGVFALCCIIAAVICRTSFQNVWMWLIPSLLTLFPVLLGLYYGFLIKTGKMDYRVMMITDKKKHIMGGLLFHGSLTQKKYTFLYEDEGALYSFPVTRGSVINTMTVGQTYLVLFNGDHPAGADNFIEFTTLETTKEEKTTMFGERPEEESEVRTKRKTDRLAGPSDTDKKGADQ